MGPMGLWTVCAKSGLVTTMDKLSRLSGLSAAC